MLCILLVPQPPDHELPISATAPACSSSCGRTVRPLRPSGEVRAANSREAESRPARIAARPVSPPQKAQAESGRQVGCGLLVRTILPFVDFAQAAKPALSFVSA